MDIDIREFDLHRVSATQSYFPCSVTCFCSIYGKCSKILNTFLVLFSNKMLIFRAGIHKNDCQNSRIAKREDHDLGLLCLPRPL